ncbi:unnamed protein product [Rotaria magnacalcarata]|uniref:Serine protease HTRA2, mitochondrial n=1 Tax=Rotaria magnacalcarata TaxID=392030 RepID=A0A819SHG5_9BILA|nr:unnamed protein product [Rotaria magnacalcarata]CAF1658109.1 unnamed protein product [Rotaria magnacalcarata]CAF1980429.1 unnamed protein product [Rotaria magnacalcarata]CAF2053687.1 unnamed protein product [Rotaria magnacalcarata]CAF2154750.1 unnamed protein product [Rotaria magnacalcarata]
MYRFGRILLSRQKYSSFYLPLLSTKTEQYSNRINSTVPFTLIFAASSLSFYEIYKRYRLYAASNNETIAFTPKGPLLVDAQKPFVEKIPYSKQYNFIADVVEHVAPAVVHIEVDLEPMPYFGHYSSSIGTTNGSGFIINETGLLLTNAHVVRNRKNVKIKLADGQRFTGTVQFVDMVADLAVVQIDSNKQKLPYLSLGDSDKIRAGEHCIAVGSPLALSNTVTAGIVSNVGRTSSELGIFGRDINYIQTDCMITGGNSGGPLVNLDGEVIGINSMKAMTGISFSLPINYAKLFLADIEKKKLKQSTTKSTASATSRRQTRYLGIKMFSLTPQIVEEMRYRMPMTFAVSKGVYIASVMLNSTAQRAGLQPGDIIIEVNGHDIETSADLIKHVQEDETLNLKVVRNNGLVFNILVTPESTE